MYYSACISLSTNLYVLFFWQNICKYVAISCLLFNICFLSHWLFRFMDYLELVSELFLFIESFLLYHGVKLYKCYMSRIWQWYPIYSRPKLLVGFYRSNSHNSPPMDMTLITRANQFKNATLRQNRWFYSSNCELFIHIQHACQHSSSNCITEYVHITRMIQHSRTCGACNNFFHGGFLQKRKVLDHFEGFTVTAMTWLTAMEYMFYE